MVPVIEVGKKLGTIIKQSSEISSNRDQVHGSGKSTGRERAALIYSTVGPNLGIGGLEVHPVRGGACVPSGEDSSKVQLVLLNVVQHGTSRDVLKGSLEVKGKVLNGLGR